MVESAPARRDVIRLGRGYDRLVVRLCDREPTLHTQHLFARLLFAWLCLRTALLLPFHATVFGPEALVARASAEGLYGALTGWAAAPGALSGYGAVLAAHLLVCAVGASGRAMRLCAPLAWVLTMNLAALAPVIQDGGDNLVHLLLLYLVFVNTSGRPVRGPEPIRVALRAVSNLAFWACMAQVALVYLTAGIHKLQGVLWQKGMALFYVLQSADYAHPWMNQLVLAAPWVAFLAAWATVAFQVLFPVLVWGRWRYWILAAGVLFHLGIIAGMGLFTFGLIMCVSYAVFLRDDDARRVMRFFSKDERLRVTTRSKWLERLDWRGCLDIEGGEFGVRDAAGPLSPSRGAWRIMGKLPACWPLLPLLGPLVYLGAIPRRPVARGASAQ